jgi:small multidrug resistance family-3 protein
VHKHKIRNLGGVPLAPPGFDDWLSRNPIFLEVASMNTLDRLVAHPLGAAAALSLAAFLEVYGDSFFQTSFYRSSGVGRIAPFLAGAAVLAVYGSVVNVPRWDFGKLLGVYVALFFVMAQVVAKVRFGQSPTAPVYAGGALIVAGGMVIAFWKG